MSYPNRDLDGLCACCVPPKYSICRQGATGWACAFWLSLHLCRSNAGKNNNHLLKRDTSLSNNERQQHEHLGSKANSDAVKNNRAACQDTQSALHCAKGTSRLASWEEQGTWTQSWWTGTDTVHWVQPNQEMGISNYSTIVVLFFVEKVVP